MYNLNIDVKRQIVSIENLNRTFTMFIDKNLASIKLPLTSSEAIRVPPHSNRMALVQILVSSINTPFFIHEYQQQNNSLTVTRPRSFTLDRTLSAPNNPDINPTISGSES